MYVHVCECVGVSVQMCVIVFWDVCMSVCVHVPCAEERERREEGD